MRTWVLGSLFALLSLSPACSSGGREGPADLVLAAYTAPREALERGVLPAFRRQWKARTGREVVIRASYLASGAQARAVADGFPADLVLLAIPPDVDRIARAGLLAPDWQARGATGGIVARTLVVIAVREGNPLGIRDFADLGREGVEVLTPNPMTSGGALWNVLAIYGAAPPGLGEGLVRGVFRNVVVMDKGARESIVNFEKGIGDAAITYEQEVHTARLAGRRYPYVIPPRTMQVDLPAAVVDANVDARGTRALAEALLAFLASDEGQRILSDYGFRPARGPLAVDDPRFPPPGQVFTIDDFGGWDRAMARFRGEGGFLRQVIEGER